MSINRARVETFTDLQWREGAADTKREKVGNGGNGTAGEETSVLTCDADCGGMLGTLTFKTDRTTFLSRTISLEQSCEQSGFVWGSRLISPL